MWHCDTSTKEYEDVTDEIVDVCPEMEDFDPEVKNLVIIDDVALKSLDRKERMRLDRLCGNWSTHRNTSCCIYQQQPNALPASIRRMIDERVCAMALD